MREKTRKKGIVTRLFNTVLALAMTISLVSLNPITVHASYDFPSGKCAYCGHLYSVHHRSHDYITNDAEEVYSCVECSPQDAPPCKGIKWSDCVKGPDWERITIDGTSYFYDANGHSYLTTATPNRLDCRQRDGASVTVAQADKDGVLKATDGLKFCLDAGHIKPCDCSSVTKQNGQAATCTEDGWKDYWKCNNTDCEKLYTDENKTTLITDLNAWKAGDGKIAKAHAWRYYGDKGKLIAICNECDRGVTLAITTNSKNYTANPVSLTAGDFAWSSQESGLATPVIGDYYVDATIKTTMENSGATQEGGAPVKEGNYLAEVTVGSGENTAKAKYSFDITYTAVTGITLNKESTTLALEGGNVTETLVATVEPSDASIKTITWSSNNTDVATVAGDGTVTAKATGVAIITATTVDGRFTATCTVTVDDAVFTQIEEYPNIYWKKDSSGRVTIRGTGDVPEGADLWMSGYPDTSVTSLIIEEGITNLGAYTFENCKSLTSVSIPASMTSIGYGAFDGCSALSNISFPADSKMTTIGGSAFNGCTSLTSFTVPSGIIKIGYAAFDGTNLTFVTMEGTTPPELDSFALGEKVEIIFVPKNAVDTYKNTAVYGWTEEYRNKIQDITVDRFVKIQAYLNEMIGLDFKVYIPENLVEKAVKMEFDVKGTKQYADFNASSRVEINGKDCYVFRCVLDSTQMEDEITAKMIYSDGAIGETKVYSFEEYLEKLERDYPHSYEHELEYFKLMWLVDSIRKFGDYMKAYEKDSSMSESDIGAVELTYDEEAYVNKYTLDSTIDTNETIDSATPLKVRASMGSKISVIVKYECDADKDYNFYINGQKVTAQMINGSDNKVYYEITSPNISPVDYDKTIKFTVEQNGVKENYLSSPLMYAKKARTAYAENEKYVSLFNSIIKYHYSAKEYAEATN